MTGVKPGGARTGALNLGGAMALEDMNLDRKNDFVGDAFDPFKIGQVSNNVNLQLQAQNAYLDKANSQGGHIWTPEQLQQRKAAGHIDPVGAGFTANLDDLDEIEDGDQSMPTQLNSQSYQGGSNNMGR